MTQATKAPINVSNLNVQFTGLNILIKDDSVVLGVVDGQYTHAVSEIPGDIDKAVVSMPFKVDSETNCMYVYGSAVHFYDEFVKKNEGKEVSTIEVKTYVEDYLDCLHRDIILYEIHEIVNRAKDVDLAQLGAGAGISQELIDFSKETYDFMKAHHFMLEEKAKAEAAASEEATEEAVELPTEEESKPE